MKKKKAIIVDLDGVLCDNRHRLHHILGKKKDWDKFYKGIPNDTLNKPILEILEKFKNDHAVLFITGRPAQMSIVMDTLNWLLEHKIGYIDILFREEGDFSPASQVKRALYRKYLKDEYDVSFALEDSPEVVDMWREEGIFTLQTEYWNPESDEENDFEMFGKN